MIMLDEFAALILELEPDITMEDIALTFMGAGGADGLDNREFDVWAQQVMSDFSQEEFEAQIKAMLRAAAAMTDDMARRRVLLSLCDDDNSDGVDGMDDTIWVRVTLPNEEMVKIEVPHTVPVPEFKQILTNQTNVDVQDMQLFFRSDKVYDSQCLAQVIPRSILWSPDSKFPELIPEFWLYPVDYYANVDTAAEGTASEAQDATPAQEDGPPPAASISQHGASPAGSSSGRPSTALSTATQLADKPRKPPKGANLVPSQYRNDLATFNNKHEA